MAAHRRSTLRPDSSGTAVLELEGTLLKDHHPFPYFMLIAFEASGLLRFVILLLSYPLIRSLDALGFHSASLRLMVFLAVAGVRHSEIHTVARAVLPKFYVDDVDPSAWGVLSSYRRRVVVTQCPRVMVEPLVKEHLGGHGVVGPELDVNRFGYATGLLRLDDRPVADRVRDLLAGDTPDVALCRLTSSKKFEPLCKEQIHPPFEKLSRHPVHPPRVIFHDGRLVCRPTPLTALLIILWIPVGMAVAAIRIIVGLILPLWFVPYVAGIFGGEVIVRGRPPPVSGRGVLFVCTHRTLMDPVVLSTVVGRRIPAVTYSISRLSEILSPIPTVRLSRDRQVDADRIKAELEKGDLVVCPEGTTCREPFLLRFSALFAELTDRIVPVAMNYRVGFFHATTARGWKAMDPIFFFMNPRPVYEVTFLNQLPVEATCAAGKSPHDVANYVQRILAATLGFECTNFTRKDKYRALAGNDGTVSFKAAEPWMERVREVLGFLLH